MNPITLTQAIRYYSDEQTCIDAVAALRWKDGKPVCPKCKTVEGGDRAHYWMPSVKRWKCYACRKQFSVKVGSIFEDSALSLDKWLIAMWMLVNCKNGVSSYEISRATGMGQKAAWFVLQRLRHTLNQTASPKLEGTVQIDECYIGPDPQNMHRHKRLQRQVGLKGYVDKTAVMGMLETTTRQVRAHVIPNAKRETLQRAILERVGFGSTLHTDCWTGYDRMDMRYVHEQVNHANEYVRGNVSTQAVENFWSCLKRTLTGTYIAVEAFHMNKYLAEQCFRFNNRLNMNDGDRFTKALAQVGGKRLTWKELTGKEAPSC